MTVSPVLSVIIITWNDAERLERCLRSIQYCKEEVAHEVIIVDDGSTDRTLAMLKAFPSVKAIENKRNLGMAPARNVGIRHAKGEYLLFLDSDTEVHPGCFANAVKALAADPASWVGGCKTFRSDGSLEYSAKSFYTLRTLLLRRTVLGKWFPQAVCLRNHLNQDKDHSINFVTDWVAGAALIVKRDAIEKLGYFDERFIYYFDDYDLCYRTWKMDRKVVYIADSPVVHHLSLRSRKSVLSALRHLRSGVYFYLKTTLSLYSSSRRNIKMILPMKRLFDLVLAGLGLILSSPLWLLIAFLIKIEDRGPVFYRQERVGKNGRIFRALKFRSMVPNAEKATGPVQAAYDDPRITRIGRFLRATAMDELPQLWNIFRGDMSFVGPRALRPAEIEIKSLGAMRADEVPNFHLRHRVRPGLTGLAQIYAPRDAARRQKLRFDLLYVRSRLFLLDLKLIALSFWITFRGRWESRERKV